MQTNDINAILSFYRRGSRQDILQAFNEGTWGHTWTVRPCSPTAMEQAGRQFTRARARQIRHIRYARLKCHGRLDQDAIIITILPDRRQTVISVNDGRTLDIAVYLEDDSLSALSKIFVVKNTDA